MQNVTSISFHILCFNRTVSKVLDIYPVIIAFYCTIKVHDFICLHAIYSWYLVSVELTIRNDNSIVQTWQRTPLKSIGIALVMFFWVIFASWHWQMLAFLLLVLNFDNYLINKINFLQIRNKYFLWQIRIHMHKISVTCSCRNMYFLQTSITFEYLHLRP